MSLTISEFFKLTKPGVLYLLMITAGASMILATNFNLDIIKALTGFLGIAFIAGSSAAINQILDLFGTLNILFNHAGTIIVKPLHESSEEDYDYLMDINVRSAFLVCNEVIPSMLKNKGGNIIITSSIGGEKGFALESLYCMTKGAVLQLARSIAVEYRDQGIRCNAICPGFVKTNHGLREIKELDEQGQNWNENDLHSVQGRICKPEEVASAVLYLASDDSSFVNGTALYVDNAWYAKG